MLHIRAIPKWFLSLDHKLFLFMHKFSSRCITKLYTVHTHEVHYPTIEVPCAINRILSNYIPWCLHQLYMMSFDFLFAQKLCHPDILLMHMITSSTPCSSALTYNVRYTMPFLTLIEK